jgi:hypothetical protein
MPKLCLVASGKWLEFGVARSPEDTLSGCNVYWLIDEVCGECLPAVNLSHVDLARSEQCPEQHGSGLADGSTVWFLNRLNSSCSRSIALVVRALRHWLGGSRVKVKSRSPASSRLAATARCLSLHLRMKALRRAAISSGVAAWIIFCNPR